jgi:repressor LexA
MDALEMRPELTPRQRETLGFLEHFVAANGYPPTIRQICVGLGLSSTQTVYAHLHRLEEKGYLNLSGGHRAIQVLPSAEDNDTKVVALAGRRKRSAAEETRYIPLVGRVAAGQPLLATENIEGYVDLSGLGRDAGVFTLQVKGDSMIEAGILDGDYILVRQQETAEEGEIVVALLNDEATVKYFHREPHRISLKPANRKLKPIYAKEVKIIGKVIASFRGYGSTPLVK